MKLPEIEISIKYKGSRKTELKRINNSSDIYTVLKQMFNAEIINWQEQMILICLNQANKVIGYYKVSVGGITGTMCDPKIIFTIALNCAGTTSIILSHNHPSGNLNPSNADIEMTKKIKEGGKLLDISVLDHIIYTEDGFYSMRDEGQI
jgi:DNA repair protein RadC